MKIRVLRLIEYTFYSAESYQYHTDKLTHTIDNDGMNMKSVMLPATIFDYEDSEDPV